MIGQKGIPALYGGIERQVEELSIKLAEQGHEVLAYARPWYVYGKLTHYRGIKIILTPTIRTKHLDAIVHTFTSTVHALFQKPDIIHYHGVGPALLSWIPRLFLPRAKVITTFHCIDRYHQKWGWFARLALKLGERAACWFPDRVIAVSKTIQNYCLNEYQVLPTYLPNGVTIPPAQGNLLLSQWKLEPKRYLLMVSRLIKHKGAHYLIAAWQLIRQQNPELFRDYKLVIVGDSSFTADYVKQLRELARGDTSIIFTGWILGQQLNELYANAALLVHPSENEGLPTTVLQAMAHSRPVLLSDIPEHREIISDERFVFSNGNVFALAKKLLELLPQAELLEEAGEKNKIKITQSYHWKDIAKKTEELYRLALGNKPARYFIVARSEMKN